MAAIDDPKTFGRARLSFADQHDIDEFLATLEKFERGEIGPDKWRAFRLVRGTYGQRQDGDVHMLRVKVPQGVLDLRQLYALATVAETYSRGFGHITTRQNIQFHFVKLHDVELAMPRWESDTYRLLLESGGIDVCRWENEGGAPEARSGSERAPRDRISELLNEGTVPPAPPDSPSAGRLHRQAGRSEPLNARRQDEHDPVERS